VYDPIQHVLESVKQNFKSRLNNDALFDKILETTTIDEVYDATDNLQKNKRRKDISDTCPRSNLSWKA
jgi:hypothetical protein